ncbi:thiamine phosphate synthase [Mesorhizobium sp.]|uniref:thiamine phosphate synthase n=1 Tax=Mesorhizobium sp. TaxID=1871066 RepID=UPI000FE8807D|nr:thiamine phosphate synthase [Mesorhizobium sp.]RWI72172.1 MAG: thiamine phosphate synthase [Mesorhizobium sp.]
MKLDPFYLIVDGAAWVERLVPLGVKLLQLRIKDTEEPRLRAEIQAAKTTCAAHGCTLVINDYWQLAIEEGCEWVHLGQEDLAAADLGVIRAAGLKLGLSTHDEAELATALSTRPDYVALGPIYPTILKKMKWAPQGLDRIADWRRRVAPLPLIAIGGLNPECLEGVFAAGADCAAVVTDITLNGDPEARTRRWIEATEQWR